MSIINYDSAEQMALVADVVAEVQNRIDEGEKPFRALQTQRFLNDLTGVERMMVLIRLGLAE